MRQVAPPAVFLVVFAAVALAQPPTQAASQAPQAPQVQQAPPMPASPRGSAATQVGGRWVEPTTPGGAPRYTDGKWITVDYGRPILRGRTNIFGTGADYGKKVNSGAPVWRAGANQTTRFKTDVPLVIGGKTLPAGEYSLFVELAPKSWTLILSTEPFQQKYRPEEQDRNLGRLQLRPEVRCPARAHDARKRRDVGRSVHDPVRRRHGDGRQADAALGARRRDRAVHGGEVGSTARTTRLPG